MRGEGRVPRAKSAGVRAVRGPGAPQAGPAPRDSSARAPPESFSEILLASAGEFPYSISSHGGVAQLGERLTGSQEVRGSIPLVSTIVNAKPPYRVAFLFTYDI